LYKKIIDHLTDLGVVFSKDCSFAFCLPFAISSINSKNLFLISCL